MRVILALGLICVVAAMPATAGRWFVRVGSTWGTIVLSAASLAAMALGTVVVLAAAVGAPSSGWRDVPAFVGRCLEAAGEIWDQPPQHWARILAAVVLSLIVVRLVYVLVRTVLDARREASRAFSVATNVKAERWGELWVVPSDRTFAFAVGLRRRAIVVSEGLLEALDERRVAAVMAHERDHLARWHLLTLLFAKGIARAFPFIPPVREAADQLELGLEMHADGAAVAATGDGVLVAQALAEVARREVGVAPTAGIAGGAVGVRIGHLTSIDPRVPGVKCAILLVVPLLVLASLVVMLPVSARTLVGAERAVALHDACHLPHPLGNEVV
ncbi:MAG: M56 family metallopeptidase [Actinomycetota bacterium]